MKVLCANEGLMSNFELLEVLRQRTRETPVALLPHVHDPFPTEMQCSDTLKKTPAGAQTKENLAKFIKAVEAFNLTPAECLNLINSKPTTDVEIHLLVARLRSKSITYKFRIKKINGDQCELAATGEMTAVCVSTTKHGTMKACSIPAEIAAKIEVAPTGLLDD